MVPAVFAPFREEEVLYPVVRLVAVDVMHNLVLPQRPSERSLHDQTVLQNAPSGRRSRYSASLEQTVVHSPQPTQRA